MTRPSFNVAREKGALGESVVRQILEASGWVVYQPMTDGPHQFDMLCIKNKRSAVAFDIKAKARMNKFPCTGVNQKHFEEYKRFSERHLMPFWIVFVDEGMRSIYGNTIEELEKPRLEGGISYPWTPNWGTALRLWPLSAMRTIAEISEEEAAALSALSQRSYVYEVRA
jgi:hypothetical protein